MSAGLPDVYSLDEIARAAYVDRAAVEALVSRGRLRADPRHAAGVGSRGGAGGAGSAPFSSAGRHTRGDGAVRPGGNRLAPSRPEQVVAGDSRRRRDAGVWGWDARRRPRPTLNDRQPPSRLVFLVDPGPRRGRRRRRRAGPAPGRAPARARRDAIARTPSVPEVAPPPAPSPRQPEPIPTRPLMAPVAQVATAPVAERRPDRRQRWPSPAPARAMPAAPEPAATAARGRDAGTGSATAPAAGPAADRTVRAAASSRRGCCARSKRSTPRKRDARTSPATSLMEVVVRSDGTVGSARVTRGLGYGLDERATAAVRQWRFEPARRLGVPVDVAGGSRHGVHPAMRRMEGGLPW